LSLGLSDRRLLPLSHLRSLAALIADD
jgi:hypothetical protein